MDRIENALLIASRVAAGLGVACLLVVACLSVLDIVMRELLGDPLAWAGDVSKLAIILIISACFPAGLLERRQIQVKLLGTLLGPVGNRVLDTIGAIATLGMFVGIAWYVTDYAGSAVVSAEYTMVLNVPLAPWWWAAAACFWACVPAQIFVIGAEIAGRPVRAPEEG